MSFAENLKYQRECKNINQAKLAETVGITQGAIAQYELGIRVPTVIVGTKIAKVLGTTVEWLVNRKENDNDDGQRTV